MLRKPLYIQIQENLLQHQLQILLEMLKDKLLLKQIQKFPQMLLNQKNTH